LTGQPLPVTPSTAQPFAGNHPEVTLASSITEESADSSAADAAVKQYAGKNNLSEVLVTRLRSLDDYTHAVTLQWPRNHGFYVPAGHDYSPLLLVESVRQSLVVISHAGLDIPGEYKIGWQFLASETVLEALRPGDGPTMAEVVVTHEPVVRRRLGSVRLCARARVMRESALVGTARVNYTAHPPSLYSRLRGRNGDAVAAFARALPPARPIAAALVGRALERDVVLAPGDAPHRWLLRADTTHQILFDHPHDHIPGMVLLEAACQAVRANAAPERLIPVTITATFSRYVELDRPCWIAVKPAGPDEQGRRRQAVTGLQEDAACFTVEIASEPGAF
jgi:2-oxo-3-(phosphooxy)propyl 3-oxoalkanoate synthase